MEVLKVSAKSNPNSVSRRYSRERQRGNAGYRRRSVKPSRKSSCHCARICRAAWSRFNLRAGVYRH